MTRVQTTFTSDDADLQRSLQRYQQQMQKIVDENRKLREEGKQGHAESHSMMAEQVADLAKIGAGVATVGAAIELVVGAYERWRDRGKEALEVHKELAHLSLQATNATGNIANAPEVKEAIEHARGSLVAEASELFQGVAGAGPASLERQMNLLNASSRVAGFTTDERQLGSVIGGINQLAPDKSAGDVADLAMKLRGMAGARAGELSTPEFGRAIAEFQKASGGTLEESLGAGAAMLQANLSSKTLEQIAAAIGRQVDVKTERDLNRDLTPEDKARNDFARAGRDERLQMLLSDEQVQRAILGGGTGLKAGLLNQERIAALGRELEDAQASDYLNQQYDAARQGPLAGMMAAHDRAINKERKNLRLAKDAEYYELQQDALEANLDTALGENSMASNMAHGALTGRIPGLGVGLFDIPFLRNTIVNKQAVGAFQAGITGEPTEAMQTDEEVLERARRRGGFNTPTSPTAPSAPDNKQVVEVLSDIAKESRAQTRVLESMARNRPPARGGIRPE